MSVSVCGTPQALAEAEYLGSSPVVQSHLAYQDKPHPHGFV